MNRGRKDIQKKREQHVRRPGKKAWHIHVDPNRETSSDLLLGKGPGQKLQVSFLLISIKRISVLSLK